MSVPAETTRVAIRVLIAEDDRAMREVLAELIAGDPGLDLIGAVENAADAIGILDDYARHVPRMLPRLTPYGSQQSAYSSARYWKHREYEASIGCAVVLAILVIKLIIKPVW